jgi:hypothetical protein
MTMRHITSPLYILSLLGFFLLGGCSSQEMQTPEEQAPDGDRTFTLSLSGSTGDTRTIVKDLNSNDIVLKWDPDAFVIDLVIDQDGVLTDLGRIAPSIVSPDGLEALMDFTIPQSVDINKPFDLYAIIDKSIKIRDGKLLVPVDAHTMYELTEQSSNKDDYVPMYACIKGVTSQDRELDAEFQHLGAMASIVVKNTSDKPMKLSGLALVPADDAETFYEAGSLPFAGNGDLPYLDLTHPEDPVMMIRSEVTYPLYEVAPGAISYGGFWFRPTKGTSPEVRLAAYDAESRQVILSEETKPARSEMKIGRAYAVFAEWDGTKLTFLDEEPVTPLPEDQSYIEMTTSLEVGDTIYLNIDAPLDERPNVWVDLNNNGTREHGEFVTTFTDELEQPAIPFKLQSQTFRIYGEFTSLSARRQSLTDIDTSHDNSVQVLFVDGNSFPKLDLSQNKALQRVSAQACGIESVVMPVSYELQEVYLYNNNLKSFTVFGPGLYAFDVSSNPELSSIKMLSPMYPMLMVVGIDTCNLDKDAIEAVYESLSEPSLPKMYEWMYSITSFDNPGSADADFTIATDKEWTVYQTSANAPDGL